METVSILEIYFLISWILVSIMDTSCGYPFWISDHWKCVVLNACIIITASFYSLPFSPLPPPPLLPVPFQNVFHSSSICSIDLTSISLLLLSPTSESPRRPSRDLQEQVCQSISDSVSDVADGSLRIRHHRNRPDRNWQDAGLSSSRLPPYRG